jgi:hypothetical protein
MNLWPKSGKPVFVRAALCLRTSTSSWWRHWLDGLGSAQIWASRWPIRGMLAYNMQTIRRSMSSPQLELVQSLVVRLDTFALDTSGQHINIAKSCMVLLGTLPTPPPTRTAQVGPLTVLASKKCLGVTFAPATAQFVEHVKRKELRRQWRQSALGPPPQPSVAWDTRLISVQLLCCRLLGLELSPMGRGLGTAGYAAAKV